VASIFLSYARQDSAKAGRVASALQAAGHTVWWDKQIGAGSRFSAEIEQALEAAEHVVVLWSKASLQSAWVLDEAAVGRDSGRLLPVMIEKVEPPLGFRQYQSIDLSGSRHGEAALQSLIDVVSRVGGPAHPVTGQGHPFPWRPVLVGMAVIALIVAGWWLWSSSRGSNGSTTIAVAAADRSGSARSLDFARSIAIDLGRYRAGPAGMLSIVDSDAVAGSKADYRVEVGLSGTGNDLRADVSLQSRDGRLLWSSAVDGQGRPLVDLRQEVAAEVGDVLRCMAELKASGKPPSADVESLFLNGCALQEPSEEALSIFRRITRAAPDFGPGWAGLALLESWSISTASEGDRMALISSARAHLQRAKALAPDYPDTIAAEATLRPADANSVRDALAVLDRGIERQPESALLHRLRGQLLMDAGRMRDAVAATRRASELNPLSTAMRDSYISALAYSGRSGEAFEELRSAESIWSGSSLLRDLRFRLALRFGDPREALRLLDTNGPVDGGSDPAGTAWRSYLEARADPRPVKIEQALAGFRARYDRNPADVPGYLQALGTFGRMDEAYRAMQAPEAIDSLFASRHILFRPYMRTIRADPRFIALTAKLGLLAFWRESGQWPDFCADPQLPYDCLAEAAKLRTERS
jgi:tetratricopeptide (TPR) repeat protein